MPPVEYPLLSFMSLSPISTEEAAGYSRSQPGSFSVLPGSVNIWLVKFLIYVTATVPLQGECKGSTQHMEGCGAEKLRDIKKRLPCTKNQASPNKINSLMTLICYDPLTCWVISPVNNTENGRQHSRVQRDLAGHGEGRAWAHGFVKNVLRHQIQCPLL